MTSRADWIEEHAADLVSDQMQAVAQFHAALRAALDALQRMPLCSPADGYDVEDIQGDINDWIARAYPGRRLEEFAIDKAREDDADAAADAAEQRREAYNDMVRIWGEVA